MSGVVPAVSARRLDSPRSGDGPENGSSTAGPRAALAVGDRGAAVFHLLSHGAFKALLFLAA
ncbi:hypothetical protein, partial [Streptomyces lavendulocolor]|uniref:hypothetical protein n=1 Tax=Streptomyces lavendulocolor TaxID=67316 RepID=UPI0033F88114